MNWLFKEEPSHYSYAALVRDGRTRWSGVKNPLAQIHLKSVRRGDRILYYHTGGEKSVVGVARAATDAYLDPDDRSGRLAAVDIAPERLLPRPVTLAEIKGSRHFATSPLVRIPRLSVMPVTDRQWAEIERFAGR
jgi:predicted RNA-binding protein with PUA-like domain